MTLLPNVSQQAVKTKAAAGLPHSKINKTKDSRKELPTFEQSAKGTRDWPHAPPHRLAEAGVYFVTARTRDQRHLLAEDSMKDWLEATLLELAEEFGWSVEAWCVLSNHYHFVAHSPPGRRFR